MAEVEVLTEKKEQPAKAISLGQIRSVSTPLVEKPIEAPSNEIVPDNAPAEKTETVTDKTEANLEVSQPQPEATSTITDEQRKAFLKEMFGDENTDIEAIKEKLKPTPAEPSEEEKKKAQSQSELDIMKLFVDRGGTPEQFNEIKNIANGDKVELSKRKAISELIEAGFSDDEAESLMKAQFHQIDIDNLEQDFDNAETEEEFLERKQKSQKEFDYGTKKLEAYSAYEQTQAASILRGLAEDKESKDLEARQEADISSKVDEMFSKLPRKQTIELGKANDLEIPPVEHEVSEDSIKQVAEILKDPAKRNNYFKNTDGTLNLPKLSEVLLAYIERTDLAKNALLEGQTRTTKELRKTFGASNPYELGIGGAPRKNNGKGAAVKIGEAKRVSPQYN